MSRKPILTNIKLNPQRSWPNIIYWHFIFNTAHGKCGWMCIKSSISIKSARMVLSIFVRKLSRLTLPIAKSAFYKLLKSGNNFFYLANKIFVWIKHFKEIFVNEVTKCSVHGELSKLPIVNKRKISINSMALDVSSELPTLAKCLVHGELSKLPIVNKRKLSINSMALDVLSMESSVNCQSLTKENSLSTAWL